MGTRCAGCLLGSGQIKHAPDVNTSAGRLGRSFSACALGEKSPRSHPRCRRQCDVCRGPPTWNVVCSVCRCVCVLLHDERCDDDEPVLCARGSTLKEQSRVVHDKIIARACAGTVDTPGSYTKGRHCDDQIDERRESNSPSGGRGGRSEPKLDLHRRDGVSSAQLQTLNNSKCGNPTPKHPTRDPVDSTTLARSAIRSNYSGQPARAKSNDRAKNNVCVRVGAIIERPRRSPHKSPPFLQRCRFCSVLFAILFAARININGHARQAETQ